MSQAISQVLTTVNAPYSVKVSAHELAAKLQDPSSATSFDASAFAFFSEVSPKLQTEFLEEMGVNMADVIAVATLFSAAAGYKLPLAA
ncbi:hypothetical protein [Pleomorphomonas oryzae]|uniref:hypothetical protein n=1 Tax=Pleomorphomonas oryzae TaxID=261934 RepID=UPI000429017C|nr:hypothetical protein [Pleomorphomonas oryzae]